MRFLRVMQSDNHYFFLISSLLPPPILAVRKLIISLAFSLPGKFNTLTIGMWTVQAGSKVPILSKNCPKKFSCIHLFTQSFHDTSAIFHLTSSALPAQNSSTRPLFSWMPPGNNLLSLPGAIPAACRCIERYRTRKAAPAPCDPAAHL